MRISDWSSDVCSSDRSALTSRLSLDFLQKNSHSTLSFTTRFSRELRPQYVTSPASDGLSHFGTLSVHLTTVPLWSRCSKASGRPAIADRKSTRLNSVTNASLVCRLLLEKKKKQ